jgi:hypothetical protein
MSENKSKSRTSKPMGTMMGGPNRKAKREITGKRTLTLFSTGRMMEC